jgi:hypothetical protein
MPRLKPWQRRNGQPQELNAGILRCAQNDRITVGSAEARSQLGVLLDYGLFENGFSGIGWVVADGDPLVLELADEFVGVNLSREFVNIHAGVVLADEVGILQGSEEAGCLGHRGNAAAENNALDRGPGLRGRFSTTLLPAAPVDCHPCKSEVKPVSEYEQVEMIVAAHGCYGTTA